MHSAGDDDDQQRYDFSITIQLFKYLQYSAACKYFYSESLRTVDKTSEYITQLLQENQAAAINLTCDDTNICQCIMYNLMQLEPKAAVRCMLNLPFRADEWRKVMLNLLTGTCISLDECNAFMHAEKITISKATRT
jgi:hypothetical protein